VDAFLYITDMEVQDDGNGLTETVHLKIRWPAAADLDRLFLRLRLRR
jgi:hypothetical protein